ncbi:hypothetical protein [Streptococcus orisratti]|uniref:hypothetical protein n=1 Tax=Streptococcus orisratti TaxID=114652 RepID=UPI0023F76B39|nr:hypothetical protein [Streptococcus orisratti]
MKIINGKQLRESLHISTTVFYKWKKAGMPYHQFPGSRAYYVPSEVFEWLEKTGQQKHEVGLKE